MTEKMCKSGRISKYKMDQPTSTNVFYTGNIMKSTECFLLVSLGTTTIFQPLWTEKWNMGQLNIEIIKVWFWYNKYLL